MRVIDCVKDRPRTELEAWERWKNRLQSELISNSRYSKKIDVKYVSDVKCDPWIASRFCPNYPNCGSFEHAMVGMAGGDLPTGFKEPN